MPARRVPARPAVPARARRRPPLLAALALVGLLSACTSSGDRSSSAAGSAAGPSAAGSSAAGSSAAGSSAAGSSAAAAPAAAPAGAAAAGAAAVGDLTGRDVVRTASLTVRVRDLRAASGSARTVAVGAGGGLEGEQADDGQAVVTLRVAPERLEQVLDALAALGEERARTVTSEDVSQQVADLDSRLATQRASVERVRALLARAGSLADVAALEAQLAGREGDLESLQARSRALGDATRLASVQLTLQPLVAPVAARAVGFGEGLASGLDALRASARLVAVTVGGLLPFVPLGALAVLAARWWARRRAAAA